MTKILFDSNYSELKAQDVLTELRGDPRLVFCEEQRLLLTSVTKLAATFNLVPSSCKRLIPYLGTID
jgi:tyrosyl-tRNA synthetase